LIFLEFFEKYSKPKFKKIRPVRTELFHADRQTDGQDEIVPFRNFANAPKMFRCQR